MANFYGDESDNVCRGSAFDTLYGGNGNDFLVGVATANEIYGGQGNDVLLGTTYLTFPPVGGTGPFGDPTFGPSGNDYLEGGTGDDIGYGADGDDTIYGGDGNE